MYPLFIVALFTIARTGKQPRYPSTDEWIKELWYIYTMQYYSAIKNNAFESVIKTCMNTEPIIQTKVSQKEKDKYCILMHIHGFRKVVLKNLLTGQQWRNRPMDMGKGEERVRGMERVTWELILPYVK